jgi:DNA-directed RNA polymerase beta subunit
MKKIIFILLLVATGFAADKVITKLTDEEVIVKTVNELPVKIEQLNVKTYSGTLADILNTRFEDVNQVHQEQLTVQKKAEELLAKQGILETKGDVVMKIIAENKSRKKLEEKKQNVEFIRAVETIFNEPNIMPDPNDPNYFSEMELINQFKMACYEVVSDNI